MLILRVCVTDFFRLAGITELVLPTVICRKSEMRGLVSTTPAIAPAIRSNGRKPTSNKNKLAACNKMLQLFVLQVTYFCVNA